MDIEYTESGDIIVRNGCKIHGDILIDKILFNNRVKKNRINNIVLCPICNPRKNIETSIEKKIKNILEKYNMEYEEHFRGLIKPFEVDFYIPKNNIAIECNGIFWHSEKMGKTQNQLSKFKNCNALGVNLLQFWEDEIVFSITKIEDIILSKTKNLKRLSAHKCEIKNTKNDIAYNFIKNFSLYNDTAQEFIGLYDNSGKLLFLAGFTEMAENIFEWNVCCSLYGLQIYGGISKIFKYFCNQYNPKKVLIKIHNDINSMSDIWGRLGFHEIGFEEYTFSISPHNLKREYTKDNLVCHTSGFSLWEWTA